MKAARAKADRALAEKASKEKVVHRSPQIQHKLENEFGVAKIQDIRSPDVNKNYSNVKLDVVRKKGLSPPSRSGSGEVKQARYPDRTGGSSLKFNADEYKKQYKKQMEREMLSDRLKGDSLDGAEYTISFSGLKVKRHNVRERNHRQSTEQVPQFRTPQTHLSYSKKQSLIQ